MGGRPPETPDYEYLSLFDESDDPVLFTSEVADEVGVSQQGAYNRLKKFEDDGCLNSKKGQERVWWLTKRGWRRTQG